MEIESDFCRRKAKKFSAFLQLLHEASEYASDLDSSKWEFSISMSEAFEFGVRPNDLRWMIRKKWVLCSDSNPPNTVEDTVLQPDLVSFDSHFVLSKQGCEALYGIGTREIKANPHDIKNAGHSTVAKPKWNAERHELTFRGHIVKRFRWPAINQERILSVFEEEKWPIKIDDPLPLSSEIEPKRRLSDSIKCLNRNQQQGLIRFRGDGTGEGVLWDCIKAPGS